jgi:hypothetical protein
MSQQWRIRVSGQPKKKPNIDLLVQAVLALAEQMQQDAQARKAVPDDPPSQPSREAS